MEGTPAACPYPMRMGEVGARRWRAQNIVQRPSYRLFLPGFARCLLFFIGLLLSSHAAFPASPDSVKEKRSEHFRFLYNPDRLKEPQVSGAVTDAESAYKTLQGLFPYVHYTEPINIRLDAEFRGATGYAAPGGIKRKGTRDSIGLRYADLPTLGLTSNFLFLHEITHLFTARDEQGRMLPGSSLSEGIADLVAEGRNGLGLPLSFAKYLRKQEEWQEPFRLILYPASGAPPTPRRGPLRYDQVLRWRIRHYVEPSLFLAYVRETYGWDKTRAFYLDYTLHAAARFPADEWRTTFRRTLGKLPEDVAREWNAAMDMAPEETEVNSHRWLSERAYALVQWYEFLIAGKAIPKEEQAGIEADLRRLNGEVAARHLLAGETQLKTLQDRIERVNLQRAASS